MLSFVSPFNELLNFDGGKVVRILGFVAKLDRSVDTLEVHYLLLGSEGPCRTALKPVVNVRIELNYRTSNRHPESWEMVTAGGKIPIHWV